LDGLDRKRKFLAQIVEKVGSGCTRLPLISPQAIEPRDHIPSAKLGTDFIGQETNLEGIHPSSILPQSVTNVSDPAQSAMAFPDKGFGLFTFL